jgi:hypothetical protein
VVAGVLLGVGLPEAHHRGVEAVAATQVRRDASVQAQSSPNALRAVGAIRSMSGESFQSQSWRP